jgi:hypothetical protein
MEAFVKRRVETVLEAPKNMGGRPPE